MSTTTTEEDTELRDLVATTLENAGVLGKIKAELRANVYIALEEADGVKNKSKLVNSKLNDFLSTTNGRLVASLVREFLEFFDLNFTMAVFDPETNIGKDFKYRERSKLYDALGMTELTDERSPLLSEILRLSKVSVLKSESPTPTEISVEDDGHTSAHISLNEDLQSKSERKYSDRSNNYSDDFSVEFGKKKDKESVSEHSENSGSLTPEIVLKDNSLDLLGLGSKKNNKIPSMSMTNSSEKQKVKDSFLSDLPPLGNVGKSPLSDLPPLSNIPAKSLAPLSKIPPKNIDSGLEANIETKRIAAPVSKRKVENVPTFGFDSDHVISEKSHSKVKSPEPGSDVTENIEEELDSFLNSEVSDDITKDETIQEGESLRADYLASL